MEKQDPVVSWGHYSQLTAIGGHLEDICKQSQQEVDCVSVLCLVVAAEPDCSSLGGLQHFYLIIHSKNDWIS